jgi:3'-phosphoadenosine 5'-phosphosulfate sulfotransferase (PAPS reductase)/FAD synthetase
MNEKAQVFSSGGGTQSCAIAALIVQGKLPKPDICVIADTGYENRRTWEYQDAVIVPALKSVGVTVERIQAVEWSANRNKGYGAFCSSGHLMLGCFTDQKGRVSKLGGYCSHAWKQEPIDRWLSKERGLTRGKYVKWIGFSRDEVKRIFRMAKGEEYEKGLIRFPLLTDCPTTRHESIRIVERMGWPTPPRSRCWMCPNQNDHEWREIRNDPEMWKLATKFEDVVRARDPHAFFHKSGLPLRDVDFTEDDDLFTGKCDSGGCFL